MGTGIVVIVVESLLSWEPNWAPKTAILIDLVPQKKTDTDLPCADLQ